MVWQISWLGVEIEGLFSVKSHHVPLNIRDDVTFPSKLIGNLKAPSKVGFFVWEVEWEKILTMDNLMRR